MNNFIKEDRTRAIAVLVYLDRKKTRSYVGKLTMRREGEKTKFYFEYDLQYLKRKYAIPLGPDLPLSKNLHKSTHLFPAFEDRIPSRDNPAYADYCKEAGISEQEKDPIVLLSTIGKRGPSSFIFEPEVEENFSVNHLKRYRKSLDLTIREFADLFKISASHLQKIESQQSSGKDILKRIEIYVKFPFVALEEIKNNEKAIHAEKYQKIIFDLLLSVEGKNKVTRELGKWADILSQDEVNHTLDKIEELKKTDWAKKCLESKNIARAISCVNGYELTIRIMHEKPKMQELDEKDIPMIIKTNDRKIWVYGKDTMGNSQLTELDSRRCHIDFSKSKLFVSMQPSKPEIYFILHGKHHTHFNNSEVINIKSSFFKIRFACAIYTAKLKVEEYEFKTGINKKSVDFKVIGSKTKNTFLIELTSLRDSDAVKEETYEFDNSFAFTNRNFVTNKNSVEERDVIKAQNAIIEKTSKFPKIKPNCYHLIIIDMRGFLAGMSDEIDYRQIAYGGACLEDVNKRYFKKNNEKNIIQGVFEELYPDETVRKKIHAIGFISEKNYTENEIRNQTVLLINPSLDLKNHEKNLLEKLFKEW